VSSGIRNLMISYLLLGALLLAVLFLWRLLRALFL
jgi:hypothetical protein